MTRLEAIRARLEAYESGAPMPPGVVEKAFADDLRLLLTIAEAADEVRRIHADITLHHGADAFGPLETDALWPALLKLGAALAALDEPPEGSARPA